MVGNNNNNTNTSRGRSLRDAPPLSSGHRNSRCISATDRRRIRARSASPVREDTRSKDRERDVKQDIRNRYQHMKGSAGTQPTRNNVNPSTASTSVKDRPTGQATFAGGNSGFAISALHKDPTVANETLRTAAHTARCVESRTAHSQDPFIASEIGSSYLQPPQNMARNPDLVDDILLESLRMADYLQRYTATDARPYRPSKPVAGYLERLRVNYPDALINGRMEGQDQCIMDLGGVGVGQLVTSPVMDPNGSDDTSRAGEVGPNGAGEADPDWYTASWSDGSDDVAKGDV